MKFLAPCMLLPGDLDSARSRRWLLSKMSLSAGSTSVVFKSPAQLWHLCRLIVWQDCQLGHKSPEAVGQNRELADVTPELLCSPLIGRPAAMSCLQAAHRPSECVIDSVLCILGGKKPWAPQCTTADVQQTREGAYVLPSVDSASNGRLDAGMYTCAMQGSRRGWTAHSVQESVYCVVTARDMIACGT